MKSHDDAASIAARGLLCFLVIAASGGCGGGGQSPAAPPSPRQTRVDLPATGQVTSYDWMVSMAEGRVCQHYKATLNDVWPVRDAP